MPPFARQNAMFCSSISILFQCRYDLSDSGEFLKFDNENITQNYLDELIIKDNDKNTDLKFETLKFLCIFAVH